jgi:predicted PurR-regulated permease PerM
VRTASTHRRSKRLAEEIANTQFERILSNSSQIALIGIGLFALVVALHLGQVILAPVFCAIVIGLMFGPVQDLLERRGVPDAASAGVVILGFLIVIGVAIFAFAAPLADWVERIPVIWQRLQTELAKWQEPLAAIGNLQEQIKGVLGNDQAMTVEVEDSGAMIDMALIAPAILSQIAIFLLSLYFFMATRDNFRISVLALCVTRRMRWRMAHVFRDVEEKVSRYLLTISMVNIGVGAVVTLVTWLLGMPTPLLWGALAAVLNYVPFVGQALMAAILFLVGMSTSPDLVGAALPVIAYWVINFIEGNFVSPNLLGRTMTINPFLIFLSLAFWIWTWGPVGGLIAVPSLLMLYSIATHILPMGDIVATRRERAAVVQKAAVDMAKGDKQAVAVTVEAEPVSPKPVRPAPRSRAKSAAAKPSAVKPATAK